VTRRVAWAGAGLGLLYVLVAALTAQLSSRPVLPLFDGFAPPMPYAWVNPPPERAGDNVAPKSAERDLPLPADGVPATNASTDDAQAIVGLDKGSVPGNPAETGVKVRVTPSDAGALGPLPAGLRAVSNAYRVEIAYQPSGTPVTRLPVKGTVALTAAENGDRMLFSADGQAWQEVAFRPFGQDHGLFTELETPGWFLVASSTTATSATSGGGSDGPPVALLVLVGIVPVVGAILVLRLPSPVPAAPPPRRGSPGTKKRPPPRPKRRR
jgi:hypothetical protein